MIGKLFCLIGFHDTDATINYYPSLHADVDPMEDWIMKVTAFTTTVFCRRCGEVFSITHHDWQEDSNEFIKTTEVAA